MFAVSKPILEAGMLWTSRLIGHNARDSDSYVVLASRSDSVLYFDHFYLKGDPVWALVGPLEAPTW